jgi:predicted transcriptional regulator
MTIVIDLPPALEAELKQQASREGQSLEEMASRVLANAITANAQEYAAAVEGIRRGFADSDAGRVISLEDFDRKMRQKYNIPDDVWPMSPDEAEAARERFCRHAGAISLGYATGAENSAIDADLAREYEDSHTEASPAGRR